MNRSTFFTYILLSFLTLSFSSCGPMLAVGTVAGVTGAAVFSKGTLTKDINASVPELHRASVAALKDLNIFIFNDILADKNAAINAEYKNGDKVDINIIKVSEIQSTLKIRIGILGDEKRSNDILGKIYEKLK